jgi:uncharacterized protein YoxC
MRLIQGAGRFMATEVTREEHVQLAGRVNVLEREVEGEKLVTRHILQETRRNSDELAAIKTRLDRVEAKVDNLGTSFQELLRNLPKIVGEAVRDAMPKRSGKR